METAPPSQVVLLNLWASVSPSVNVQNVFGRVVVRLNEIILRELFKSCLKYSEQPKHTHLPCFLMTIAQCLWRESGSQCLPQRGTQHRTLQKSHMHFRPKASFLNSGKQTHSHWLHFVFFVCLCVCFLFLFFCANTVTLLHIYNKIYITASQLLVSLLL